jgi:AraC-like DNA-binding protein
MASSGDKTRSDWEEQDLGRREAATRWQNYFAERQGTPVDVDVYDPDAFTARLVNRGVGQVRILRIKAPAQRIVHRGTHPEHGGYGHLVHFLYSLQGTLNAKSREKEAEVRPGTAVMLDNAAMYELDMKTPHEAIDMIMPLSWLERFLPDPLKRICDPIDMMSGWAPPLACMLETISLQQEEYPAPRPMMAEQLGTLLAFAMRSKQPATARPGDRMAQQIMHRIENSYADPELTPDRVAKEFKISKRYLQALLSNSGTSFVRELNAVRLDRASQMLTDPLSRSLAISDIAFRCGFLDPAYFTRQFRKRFDATPRVWREMS